jgi:hypothetical protein
MTEKEVKREFLVDDVRVTPVLPANKTYTRFKYKLEVRGKKIPGLWELDSANVSKQTMTYKKVKEVF